MLSFQNRGQDCRDDSASPVLMTVTKDTTNDQNKYPILQNEENKSASQPYIVCKDGERILNNGAGKGFVSWLRVHVDQMQTKISTRNEDLNTKLREVKSKNMTLVSELQKLALERNKREVEGLSRIQDLEEQLTVIGYQHPPSAQCYE